jgi:glucose/arabinose dehydrogenase
MNPIAARAVFLAATFLLGGVCATFASAATTELVADGFERPVFVASPPGDTGRLFVIEQHSGRIRIIDPQTNVVRSTDFLHITGLATGDEQGLLGLAFDPDYDTNGYFYVNVTVSGGDTEIRRYTVSSNPDVADPASFLLLRVDQPQANHNGGWLGFGPDGYLYISLGDGGASNDSGTGHTAGTGNAQDTTSNLLGKILRIDVHGDAFPADSTRNYAIPPSNPFVGVTGDDEIWAYGLRNPFRASFDRATGDLWIGDVGQGAREEIDFQPAGSDGGENYGWRLREGTIANPVVGGPKPAGAIDPIYDYAHGDDAFEGFVVTGGYVYRGPVAELAGTYFFADFATERIWSLVHDGSAPSAFDGTNYDELADRTAELDPPGPLAINSISSFGEDASGNLYIVDLGGEVFRIVGDGVTTTTTTTTLPESRTCGDPFGPASADVTVGDALYVLRASVGTSTCAECLCDVNSSGDITAADALAVLRVAVGQDVALVCPAC